MGPLVVSGYIDIPNHPRPAADYKALGAKLEDIVSAAGFPMIVGGGTVEETFLYQVASDRVETHAVADNPAKNTLAYHCVMHQKFIWLWQALDTHTDQVGPLVWIDYGILHVPGVTAAVITDFLKRVVDYGVVTLPGCWPKRQEVPTDHPCWRFCGGLMVVPCSMVKPFCTMAFSTVFDRLAKTRHLDWEVNTLARLELLDQVPIIWYQADHNETMFTKAP
jgi:hypothetical protein